MPKSALITGITGQDGSYLAEFLLAKGYEVHGIIRRSSSFTTGRIDHIYKDRHDAESRLFLHYGDLTDSSNLTRVLSEVQPDEVYNLGAQSHVAVSFDTPEYTADVDALFSVFTLLDDPGDESMWLLDIDGDSGKSSLFEDRFWSKRTVLIVP